MLNQVKHPFSIVYIIKFAQQLSKNRQLSPINYSFTNFIFGTKAFMITQPIR